MKKEIYSPTWLNDELNLPRDRQTLNAWARAFVALNPIVSSTVEFYSKIPLKFLTIKGVDHDEMDRFWNEQKERVGLDNILVGALRELITHGEVTLCSNLDERAARWSEVLIQNPDYVIVKKNLTGKLKISLRPDERLRDAVLKNKVTEIGDSDPKIIKSIQEGKNIELEPFYTAFLATKTSSYDVRGTSHFASVIKLLVSSDQIRAEGNEGSDEYKEIQALIKRAIYYPFEKQNNISKDMIVSRVENMMKMLTSWLQHKFFSPVAKINDFYEYKDGNKTLCIPEVKFDSAGFSTYLDLSWSS